MSVPPREAFGYALSREMLTLYGVFVGGYVLLIIGTWFGFNWATRGGGGGLVGQLLAALLTLAGFVTILGAVIGFAYKVIADANSRARGDQAL